MMRTRLTLATTAIIVAMLCSATAVVHATTYAANSWDCTNGNLSPACAQADLPALPTGREDLTTVTAPDGFIYAVGGYAGSAPLNTVQAFSVATGWLPVTAMPTARFSAASVAVPGVGKNGYVYVIGGSLGNGATGVMEVYDTSSNAWGCSYFDPNCSDAQQAYTPLPTPRSGLTATLGADGRIYTMGGFANGANPFSTVVEVYNPAADTWDCSTGDTATLCTTYTQKPVPTARGYGGAVTGPDGRIYLIGGQNLALLQIVEAYDPTTRTWQCSVGDGGCAPGAQTLAPMPTARQTFGIARGPDNRIYVFGGNYTGGSTNRVEAYTPGTGGGAWICSMGDSACPAAAQTLNPVPTSRTGPAAAVGPDHRIYVTGGSFAGATAVEAYTVPATGPTAARVSRITTVRHGVILDVRWRLAATREVTGFLLYGGQQRLTSTIIPVHPAAAYHARVRWSGATTRLSLHVLLRNGRTLEVGLG